MIGRLVRLGPEESGVVIVVVSFVTCRAKKDSVSPFAVSEIFCQ